MMTVMSRALMGVGLCWALVQPAWSNGLDALESFLKQTKSGRADFTQVVTPPPKAGQSQVRTKTSTGTFSFMRPSRFRFEYQKPFPQAIVADGQTLWLYDPDLEQVTARKQAQALGSTPAALVAIATDLASLQKDFTLEAQPDEQGLQWVLATPKNHDNTVQSVRMGLRGEAAGHVSLAKLEILDAMGQRSVLSFENFSANPAQLGVGTFQFVPPKGMSVIRP